ncbi:MAG TPA: serine hydrolase [Candidatus Polarisedimenticolia bacterium]|nr:serine hydrolase [Candidatus Polarisedimenticolia bacterium]
MKSSTFSTLARFFCTLALAVNANGLSAQTPDTEKVDTTSQDKQRVSRFEKQVDEFRGLLKIPGMSAVIIRDQKTLWTEGFGFADLEKRIPASADTLYHIASLTKTFAATLVMQLVEQGKLDLDEPMSRYSGDFKDDSVRIKHLLSHTSQGTPGERYQYSGDRYDYLTAVIEKKTGKPLRQVMVETFLDPLAMDSSVPGHDVADDARKWSALGKQNLERYASNLSKLAQPYTLYGDGEVIHVSYPPRDSFGAAAGLLSTVLDMAKYDVAIDQHRFLKKETQEKAWTAFVSNSGRRLPHGLGWFVSDYQGVRLIWHFGNWGTGFSAIYLKVPGKNLSLVMLANSEALSDHQFAAGSEDITSNVFACTFLRLFLFEDSKGGECERDSQSALAKWLKIRRARARVPIQLGPQTLDTYVGQYQLETPPNRILTVSQEDGRLFLDIPRNSKSELFAESKSKFFLKVRPLQVVFVKEGGRVTRLEAVSDGQTLRAKRLK